MSAPGGPSLGRRFPGHDPRSRGYGVRAALAAVDAPVVRVPHRWRMPVGPFPLDQGAEGACTGYGLAHELACGPVVMPGVDRGFAERRYERNRAADRAMGNDWPDGASVLATMKAAQADGLISGYRWAFGVDDVVDTVCNVGPVCLGIAWRSGMYDTRAGGLVVASGDVVGGHFITVVGYDIHPAAGPCVLWLNSWGSGYGVGDAGVGVRSGIGWVPLATLRAILAADGEAVVPADYLPPPIPAPAPARPAPWWVAWLRRIRSALRPATA